ncbi:hypothetical protein PN290_02175 [Romboutsia sp. 1001216sp1]|nr:MULTISPECIES: hypothetical protein [unclassified Romboutsia]MDB8792650.1 hypothetical protein [Romboutsia sp. 1001216sp1]MDB8796183.1 hypothetical protein [Romboutsia sp. 1001216sp1]MDB8798176.1 hypothetical protein [Romboutsia sp. 1001216sp1]
MENELAYAIFDLVDEGKRLLYEKYNSDEYNIDVNCGEVRGVIPDMMKY